MPGPIASDEVDAPAGSVPEPFSHRLLAQEPIQAAGGQVRIVDSSNFPAATTIAAALVEVEPGGMRELHWHPNADEWQYYIAGRGRMTVFASGGKARTFDYQAGDVGYVPFAMGHYVENTGDEPLRFLEMFRSDHFADISLNQWMALTPPELVQAHLNLDAQTMAPCPRRSPSSSRASRCTRSRGAAGVAGRDDRGAYTTVGRTPACDPGLRPRPRRTTTASSSP